MDPDGSRSLRFMIEKCLELTVVHSALDVHLGTPTTLNELAKDFEKSRRLGFGLFVLDHGFASSHDHVSLRL